MSALIVLLALGLWIALGLLIWTKGLMRLVKSVTARVVLAIAFAAAWLFGPFLDEYLGRRQFDRLCAAIPKNQFFEAVSVGEGPFFDSDRRPKWTTPEEWRTLRQGDKVYVGGQGPLDRWDRLFSRTQTTYRIADWPIPVLEEKTVYTSATTGQLVWVTRWRGSPGGWMKRVSGWGSHAPYQCIDRTPWPDEATWIKF